MALIASPIASLSASRIASLIASYPPPPIPKQSSGTSAALLAMDGCQCKKALVFGMPCCKKWLFYRPEKPLYYQDDNAPCYVYAYADQMVADAWLALEDKDRVSATDDPLMNYLMTL